MTPSPIKKRIAVCGKFAFVALQLGTLAACQEKSDVSANRRRLDSIMAHRDTAQVRIAREQDSMIAIMDGRAPGNLGATPPGTTTTAPIASEAGAITPLAKKQTSPATAPGADTSAAQVSGAKGAAATLPGAASASLASDQPAKAPINTHEDSPANRRARAMGDSIANARADRMLGITAGREAGGDTIRGIVEMQGKPPAARAALRVDKGPKLVALTGLAGEGLSNLVGADVMVHGIKISALDVVVSSYIVRAMQGAPALDGKLRSNAGVWSLELSDKSGVKRLSAVPSDLQMAENARVWIVFAPGTSTPKQYGVIAIR